MIPPINFWWLSRPPPPQHVFIFQANLSGPPSESFQSFQWFPLPTDLQGIKNDRSLMCLPVIMQHANKAYNVQRAYRGPTIWFLSGGGEGGGRGDLRKKYPEVWFWAQKSLARKYLPYNSFICQGKAFYDYQRIWGKKFLRKPMKSPKSCYCLILRLRHQSLIVTSRSKLVHVNSLLHDECNTAGS